MMVIPLCFHTGVRAHSAAHSFDLSKTVPLDRVDTRRIEMLNVQTIAHSEKVWGAFCFQCGARFIALLF